MAADEARVVERKGLRAWLAPGIVLAQALPPSGDPDRLLMHPRCRIVKFQEKVIVGLVDSPAGRLYVKRYNVHAWRAAFASRSPAAAAWEAAAALRRLGFATPAPVAALEFRRGGLLRRSFFVTHEVAGALTADLRWQAILADPDAARRRAARRVFAERLGDLFRRLHAAGVYHNDLKDVNVLVTGPDARPEWVLLDLERVRLGHVSRRRRVKNLVQLARTLGPQATASDRLRFLAAYLGPAAGPAERRTWAETVLAAATRKDRGRRRAAPPESTAVSCTIIAQNEEEHIERCLESIAWCDEILVVDGGSVDRTVEIARRFAARVVHHAWPGHKAQKQHALDLAGADWVLNVDADERVTPELSTEIQRSLAREAPVDGYSVPRLVPYLGRWWYRGGWYPRPVVRLVRRAATIWGGTDPHERAEVRGRVVQLHAPIIHHSYRDVADHIRTVNTLTTLGANLERGRRSGAGRLVGEPLWRFFRSWAFARGALEGFPGFFVAATGAFYVFLRWAKVRERGVRATEASDKRADGRHVARASP
jgi:hypothetical protein